MTHSSQDRTKSIWNDLMARGQAAGGRSLRDLTDDAARVAAFGVGTGELHFDYARTSLTVDDRHALLALAEASGLGARRDAMFAGDAINETENRAVLHTALRAGPDAQIFEGGQDVMGQVRQTLGGMEDFSTAVRMGRFTGASGLPISDVINIGIGGSDLGPAMAVRALGPYHDGPACHFVSNIDGAAVADRLKGLDPATTLVIVASKTFTTQETMTNAASVRDWMVAGLGHDAMRQFAALSSAPDKTADWGIPADQVFGFADWVGGRYSIWGPIGLSLMLAIGPQGFRAFLAGASAMDQHFQTAPLGENMPVMHALVGLWHHQILGHATRAVIPYEDRLARFPAYLQQLEMESNGKGVTLSGDPLPHGAGPVVWGEPGTNAQHAFFQSIHQGSAVIPVEFLLGHQGHEAQYTHHHDLLVANCLAQADALANGRTMDEARAIMLRAGLPEKEAERLAPHRAFPGNRPSVLITYPKLTPGVLGQLIALYEHRVFVEGVILGLNSFDQWGVELGKERAGLLAPALESGDVAGLSAATAASIARMRG